MVHIIGRIILRILLPYWGGQWEQVKDVFILAAGDTYLQGQTVGEATHVLSVNEMPSHSHQFVSAPRLFVEQNVNSNEIISPEDGSANNMTYTTDYTGGSQAHNNMPPYRVAYCWKRIA